MSVRPADKRTRDFGIRMRATATVLTKTKESSLDAPAKGVPST
jgi:hypothetical protein